MPAVSAIPFQFYQRLSPRERTLSLLVGGTAFLLANLLVITTLVSAFQSLRRDCTAAATDLHVEELFARDQPIWAKRTAWLRATQPVLVSRDRAGAALDEQVQALARGSQVLISSRQIHPFQTGPLGGDRLPSADYQPVTVEIKTQSDWKALVKFLQAVQRPEQFLVIELATLHSDPADATRMEGHFSISKWYAPAAGVK